MPRPRFSSLLVAGALLLVGSCSRPLVTVQAQLAFGPYGVDSSQLGLDPRFTAMGGGVIPNVPCTAGCPTGSTCNASALCDPDPITFELPSGTIDLLNGTQIGAALSVIRSITIESAEICIANCPGTPYRNTLNIDVPALDLFWGPSTAVASTDAGVHRLGTSPVIGAMIEQGGSITLDPAGVQALSDFVTGGTSNLIRLFAVGTVDFAPGDALPTGAMEFKILVTLSAQGDPIGLAGG